MKVACLWFSEKMNILPVAEHCLRLSPQICFRPGHAVFIEYGKCHRLYSEESFKARLQVTLRRAGLAPQVGFAEDIPRALLRAKYPRAQAEELPISVLIDLADPFDRDPVLQKYILRMIASFRDLGIQSLQDFKRLPLSELANRFGAAGILCHQRIQGEASLVWPLWKPEEVILEKNEFPYFEFYGELEPILFVLKSQLDKIFQRLFSRSQKAQKMEVRLYCEVNSQNPQPYRSFLFDFLFPQSNAKGSLQIIQERLSREFAKNPITSPIEALESLVTESIAASTGQKNFLHNREEVLEKVNALLGRLTELHGKDNVFHARLTEDRRPENSWRKVTSAESSPSTELKNKIPLRPTYLIKPEKIEIQGDFLFFRGRKHRVLCAQEFSEKICGAWQENPASGMEFAYEREYFTLELQGGQRVVIFRTPRAEHYLQGYFG